MNGKAGWIEERSINDKIGEILRSLHPQWGEGGEGGIVTENTQMLVEGKGKKPDIVVWHPGGLPVVIESEYHPAPNVEDKDARPRLGQTLNTSEAVEQVIALRLPKHLREVDQARLLDEVRSARYEFCLISEKSNQNPQGRWPKKGWIQGGIEDLATFIEHTSLSEKRMIQGMEILIEGVNAAAVMYQSGCSCKTQKAIAKKLHQPKNEQTARMAMAIIANAFTFQSAIVGKEDVKTISEMKNSERSFKDSVIEEWKRICEDINYVPIFLISADIVDQIDDKTAQKILETLSRVSAKLSTLGATTQHDFSGRLFQRLISDRKYLATFYTLPESATLLAEIAISRLGINWKDKVNVTSLRVADFACGTGALLNAAYGAILARYRRGGGVDSELHPSMMEEVLVGTDIMPAATHLTTSILSSAHPKTTFQDTKIATMEYGETFETDDKGRVNRHIRIGALDLIEKEDVFDFMRADQEHQSGISSRIRKPVKAPNESFDLVIMNPPFTKSTNHAAKRKKTKNPPFAAFDIPSKVQSEMAKKTRKLANSRKSLKVADMYAGLATHFMDIADTKVKRGGVVALVISAAFASGDSWKKMRNLLETRYEDIIVVSIAAAKSADKSFSSDTGMVEVLVVATRKVQDIGKRSSVSYFNFPRRPSSILEAVEFAKMISSAKTSKHGYSLRLGTSDRVGHCIKANSGFSNAIGPAGAICVGDLDVSRAAISLAQGRLSLPHLSDDDELEVVRLKELGDVCCGHRSIENSGPFDLHDLPPGKNVPFPILWAHDVSPVEKGSIQHRESCMMIRPDRYGDLKTVEDKDGKRVHSPKHTKEDMETLWKKNCTRLCFNSDFQLNSQCLGACIPVDAGGKVCDVLGGQAWPGFRCKDKRHVIPLALWMNTTLGLFSFWCTGTRQQDGRSRISVKLLPLLAVPDMQDLTDEQIAAAKETFRVFSKKNMRPANEAWRDDVRQGLDRAVMIDVLGLPERILEPLDLLREKWCAEPSVHGGQSTRPPGS